MEKINSEALERLYEAVLKLKTTKECADFFEDICTIKEMLDISQRLQVAEMLDNKKNYQEITKQTGASTATISRVNKCLVYGSGGYKTVLERLKTDGE